VDVAHDLAFFHVDDVLADVGGVVGDALDLPTNVPAGACGQVYLQALDLTSCGYSDVVLLQ
jgi:hypothetical protein